ncbi:hypothetical protein TNCV_3748781 [Trichonephila clavipes]|nr:hypothetical protein TNCV_3748781 [Trichonephila clavipes]
MKSLVYEMLVPSVEDLIARISVAAGSISVAACHARNNPKSKEFLSAPMSSLPAYFWSSLGIYEPAFLWDSESSLYPVPQGCQTQRLSLIPNLHSHILLLELVGKNCHSGPKEPQKNINGNRDESPSLSDYCLAVDSLGVGDVPTPVRGCCVSKEGFLTPKSAVTEEKGPLLFFGSGGFELFWTGGNGIPSVREQLQT